MKIVTVVGARPQFVKAAVLSRLIAGRTDVEEVIIHTGQHFDDAMSEVFFKEMDIPKPHYNLQINGLSHGAMTGQMMIGIEDILQNEKPKCVLVYGDTNSTLAGALTAQKLGIPVVHIEAGLRSFNMQMPEEVNRIITDRISSLLFVPSEQGIKNLQQEGFDKFPVKICRSGDVMQDAAIYYCSKAIQPKGFDCAEEFVLATVHRAENTSDPVVLKRIFKALDVICETTPVVLPIHPGTKAKLVAYGIQTKVKLIPPVSYFEMIYLLQHSKLVLTDSGGVQKEAFFFKKPCVTMREQTEWVELVEQGFNLVVGTQVQDIVEGFKNALLIAPDYGINLYGNGTAGEGILNEILLNFNT